MKKLYIFFLGLLFISVSYGYDLTAHDKQNIITTTNKFEDYIAKKGETSRKNIVSQIQSFADQHKDNERFQSLINPILKSIRTSDSIQIQAKVLAELDKMGMPDIKYIYSTGAIQNMPLLLNRLLNEKEKAFDTLVNTPLTQVDFATLEKYYEDDNLDYLSNLLYNYYSVNSNDIIKSVVEDFQPVYSDFSNETSLSPKLYAILKQIKSKNNLDEDQTVIVDNIINGMELNGISLTGDKLQRLKDINAKLSELSIQFGNNELDSERNFIYYIEDVDTIKDMPQDSLDNAHKLALAQNKSGYAFNYNTAGDLTSYSTDEKTRQEIRTAYKTLASTGDYDNRPIVLQMLKLRDEMAKLLGFKNFGEYSLSSKMAPSPEFVMNQEDEILARVKIKADKDLQEIKDYFNLTGLNVSDVSYYSRILQEKKYEVDAEEIKNYFEYENVKKGLFDIANKLYGFELKRMDVDAYADDVEYYEVYKEGKLIGYYILDAFYNPNKSSGCWANILRTKNINGTGVRLPIALNVLNFQKGKDVTLLSHDDVLDSFHEFGHAIHALSAASKYSQLNGLNVEWDFVEVPSQFMENYTWGEGLKTIAKNYKTGEPMSDELIEKLDKLKKFMTGIYVNTQIGYSRIDMLFHTQSVPDTVEGLDDEFFDIINSVSYFKGDKSNKTYTAFSHLFNGGYSAGYYSYIRSQIIEFDIFSVFSKNGIFDKQTATKFYDKVLSQGSRKPAIQLFEDFMGTGNINLEGFYENYGF